MNISEEFNSSGLIYDRFSNQSLSLPYSFDSIKIQPNDTVTYDVLNLKYGHLYDNFLYLYKNCKIASNLLPVSSSAILGLANGLVFAWYNNLSTSQFEPATGSFFDTNVFFAINNNELPVYSMFFSNGSILYVLKSDKNDTSIALTLSADTYNTEKTTNVNFEKIVRITDGPNKTLLILDKTANTLYQYDASGFYTNDTVLQNRLIFLRFIGGFGSILDKLSFNGPNDVVTYGKNIYVLDSGNYCIKQYDENLNWKNTYRLIKDLKNNNILKLRVDATGNFFALTDKNTIFVYSNNFEQKSVYNINDLEVNENATDIVFSASDTNIFYIVTNLNIYKRFVSNLNFNAGKYLFYNFNYNNTQTISCFAAIPYLDGDKTLVVSKSGSTQIIGSFFDNKNLYDILTISDFDVYSLGNIEVDSEEYVQSWVINKSLSKLILNHMRLRDQIIGKFLFVKDANEKTVFNFTRYLTTDEISSILFDSNITNFIGQNEVVSNASINRCLKNIYSIQTKLLTILKDEQNTVPYANSTVFLWYKMYKTTKTQ